MIRIYNGVGGELSSRESACGISEQQASYRLRKLGECVRSQLVNNRFDVVGIGGLRRSVIKLAKMAFDTISHLLLPYLPTGMLSGSKDSLGS